MNSVHAHNIPNKTLKHKYQTQSQSGQRRTNYFKNQRQVSSHHHPLVCFFQLHTVYCIIWTTPLLQQRRQIEDNTPRCKSGCTWSIMSDSAGTSTRWHQGIKPTDIDKWKPGHKTLWLNNKHTVDCSAKRKSAIQTVSVSNVTVMTSMEEYSTKNGPFLHASTEPYMSALT